MTNTIDMAAMRDPETYAINGAAMEVHRILGMGFLEPVYQSALEREFDRLGVPFGREVELPVYYKGQPLGVSYRADFLCYGDVLVELKALDRLTKRESAQIVHYLAASRLNRGLLLNFGTSSLQYKRFVGPRGFSGQSPGESAKSVDTVGRKAVSEPPAAWGSRG
jgi:GxxExxY protein